MRKGAFFILFVFSLVFLSDLPAGAEAFHEFKLGTHSVEETTVEFVFPDEKVKALYVFNLAVWNALDSKADQAIFRLYDGKKNLLDEGKSVCLNTKNKTNFGSIVFNGIDRGNVRKAAYFTLAAVPCSEGEKVIALKDNPELRPLFMNASAIASVLLGCLQTGQSEQACICAERDKLKKPVAEAELFLKKHPGLNDTTLALFEVEYSQAHGGFGKVSISMPVQELVRFGNSMAHCK